jgi:hypothetical protein
MFSWAASFFDLLVQDVEGRHGVIFEIDRHLRHIVLVHLPSHALDHLQAPGCHGSAPPFAQIQCDAMGLVGSSQNIDVVGDQKVAGTRCGGPPCGYECSRAEIGLPFFIFEPVGQAFVFAMADIGQAAPVGCSGGMPIQKYRDTQCLGEALTKRCGDGSAFGHGDVGHRYERADIHGAEAGVLAAVPGHIDMRSCRRGSIHGPFDNRFGTGDKGIDGAVGARPGVDVEQGAAFGAADGIGNGRDGLFVAALGEVGYTFDNLMHGNLLPLMGLMRRPVTVGRLVHYPVFPLCLSTGHFPAPGPPGQGTENRRSIGFRLVQ